MKPSLNLVLHHGQLGVAIPDYPNRLIALQLSLLARLESTRPGSKKRKLIVHKLNLVHSLMGAIGIRVEMEM